MLHTYLRGLRSISGAHNETCQLQLSEATIFSYIARSFEDGTLFGQ